MSAPVFFDNVGATTIAHPQSYVAERIPTWADHQTLGGAIWRDFTKLEVTWLVQMGWEALTAAEFQALHSVWNSMALGNSMTYTDLEGKTFTVSLDQTTLKFLYTPYTGSIGGPFQTLYTATLSFRAISTDTYSVP